MATIKLSRTLLDTDLSNLLTPSQVLAVTDRIGEDFSLLISNESFTAVDPIISNGGKTYTYKNPVVDGYYGTLSMKGSAVIKYDAYGDPVSGSLNFNNLVYANDEGTLKVSATLTGSANSSGSSYKITSTGINYEGSDGSKWSIKESESYSYKYNYNTDIESETYSSRITSLSSSDTAGNTINYSGNYTYNNTTDEYSGYMTSVTLTVGGTSLKITGLKVTYDELLDDGNYSFSTLNNILPEFLTGNDTITVSSTDSPNDAINGYAGNDKITGSNEDDYLIGDDGNDTLIGGAGGDVLWGYEGNDSLDGGVGFDELTGGLGSDKLKGGMGGDLFFFALDDYDFSNLSKVAVDTVTDFKIAEGDSIYLQGFEADIGIAANKAAGISEEWQLFYDKSSGTVYYDAEYDGPPVAIVKIIGIPKTIGTDVFDEIFFIE
ncbi:RTX calcium-binding nonapeptide repeat [Methylophilaceae bacterium]